MDKLKAIVLVKTNRNESIRNKMCIYKIGLDPLGCLKSGSIKFIGEDSWAIAALRIRNVTQKWRQSGKKKKQGWDQAESNQIDININPGMDENQESHLRLWN